MFLLSFILKAYNQHINMCDNPSLFSNTQGNILHTHLPQTSHAWLSDHLVSACSDIPHSLMFLVFVFYLILIVFFITIQYPILPSPKQSPHYLRLCSHRLMKTFENLPQINFYSCILDRHTYQCTHTSCLSSFFTPFFKRQNFF